MFCDEGLHFLVGHGGNIDLLAVLKRVFLDQLVRAESFVAGLAIHERVVEAAHMAGGHPGLGGHEDGAVDADIVAALGHEFAPPRLFDIVFEFHAERAIVPGVGQAAIDLRAGEDKSPSLAQSDDLFHGLFTVFHVSSSFLS